MSAAARASIARRPLLKGLLAAAGVAAAAIAAVEGPRLFAPRYAPSPFDDVLAQLPDRENAIRLGAAFLTSVKHFDAAATAGLLRARLRGHSLAATMNDDLLEARLSEARGWVLPESLALLCALAARAG